ncbi:uncharacterized protein BDCG_03007 [Blastomyces dermatitidis ER-3]|uniref:Uncharacterized protein n=3 Tax=Blastomyces TaxID=229219 RepID=A0A179UH17_BLAGS|nr:uncharacterized protein BDBG_02538 [Blastomyces gilchristii SLH14081]XP_045275128.1 uncharacterized protein BDCG_03007 [Blastomyces dermatitidis ER-3]EGE86456.1 hypothetical protein BDDG_09401 [Blastomyces dermatitidis ATCC 18188]EQL33128.1 hypothetical protein BDFG_04869 [Blastomyces dermatitidis ATCC 26199]EEQ87887.2 hypothetical protein BDCG_03007 [Blastomyces dermatitidis ER-3]OAT06301.1 hypothetical protein BDBG_02538 [Blastomyces gilchristii SLH14081]
MTSPTSTRVKEKRDTRELEEKNETEAEREAREKEDVKRRLENRERAFIAASRRGDRTMEARFESALRASEVHKERTGKGLRITLEAVEREEMYDELDDEHGRKRRCHIDSLQLRSQSLDVHLHPYMLANFAKTHAGQPFPQLNGMHNPYHTGPIPAPEVYGSAIYRFNGVPGVEGMFNNPFSPSVPNGRPNSLPISHNTPGYESQGFTNFNGQSNRLNRRVASDPAIDVTHLHHAGSSTVRPESHPQKSIPSYSINHPSQQQQQWQQHLEQTRQQGNHSTRPPSNIQQLYRTVQQVSPTGQQRTSSVRPAPNIRRQSYQDLQQPRPRRLNTQYRANQVIRMNSFDCMRYAHTPATNSSAEGMGTPGSYPSSATEYNWGVNNSAVNSAPIQSSISASADSRNSNNHNCMSSSGSVQEPENQALDPAAQCKPIPINTKKPMVQTPCLGTSPVSRGTSAGSLTTSGSSLADPSLPSPAVNQGFCDQNALTMGLSEYLQNSILDNNDLFAEGMPGSETSSFFQDALPDVNGLELSTASHEGADDNPFLKYDFSDTFGISSF